MVSIEERNRKEQAPIILPSDDSLASDDFSHYANAGSFEDDYCRQVLAKNGLANSPASTAAGTTSTHHQENRVGSLTSSGNSLKYLDPQVTHTAKGAQGEDQAGGRRGGNPHALHLRQDPQGWEVFK